MVNLDHLFCYLSYDNGLPLNPNSLHELSYRRINSISDWFDSQKAREQEEQERQKTNNK